ncbi:MAG: hypothetical protein ACREX7_07060, partial [Casimicrobiaceae bacterium]
MTSPTRAARPVVPNVATAARGLGFIALVALCLAPAAPVAAPMRYDQRPETQAFIAELVADDAFDRRELGRLFAQATYQPKVVAAMSRPVLAPPKWSDYAPQFLNPER